MKTKPYANVDHVFRLPKPPAKAVKEAQRSFLEEQTGIFQRYADYRRHKAVIEASLISRLFGDDPIEANVRGSLAALRDTLDARIPPMRLHDAPFSGPPIFQMKPGLNLIGPPYDFGLHVALGSNQPMVHNSLASGSFSVVATALPGTNTFGAAGMGLFIVPSKPNKTLSIRPYFTWFYIYTCESHGPPTAHSSGVISASVSGRHNNGSSTGLPGKSAQLWSASSDLGNDAHTLSYACQASADASRTPSGRPYRRSSFTVACC